MFSFCGDWTRLYETITWHFFMTKHAEGQREREKKECVYVVVMMGNESKDSRNYGVVEARDNGPCSSTLVGWEFRWPM